MTGADVPEDAQSVAMGVRHQRADVTNLFVKFAIAAAIALSPMYSVADALLTGKADVVDADTIKVGGISVRLYGIDAPEDRQTCERDDKPYACGKRASEVLADLIGGRPVQCEIVGKDDFRRALGVCRVADIELNRTMVRDGWAFAFTKYSDRYAADQVVAEASKAGLWAGTFAKPWDWRLGAAASAQEERACTIKGNINGGGEQIYHLPFQHFYPRVRIDETKGERWFCTEEEALTAGWRRALR